MRRPPLQLMPEEEWEIYRKRDFTGGENLKVLPEFLTENQLLSGRNCVINEDGILETREGKTVLNTESLGIGGIIAMFRYSKEDGTKYLVVQHGTSLYAVLWDGLSLIETFGTAIKEDLAEGAKLRGRVWKDKLFLWNGTDNTFTFDGSTCADITGAPKAQIGCVYAGRLWLVPVATPNILQFCALEDYTTWDALNLIKVRDGDGDVITGLSPQPGGLLIFKQNTVWALYGTNKDNFQLDTAPVSRYVGCIAIDSLLDDGMFLGKDNLYSFTLQGVSPLPQTHTPLFDTMSISQKQAVVAVAHPAKQRAYVYLGGGSRYTLCVHSKYAGAITTWGNMGAGCFCAADDKDDTGLLLIGDNANGIIYSLSGETDDSTDIETIIKTPYDDMGKVRRKVWRSFQPEIELVNQESYSYQLQYDTDFENVIALDLFTGATSKKVMYWDRDRWDVSFWTQVERVSEPYYFSVRGNRISFSIKTTQRIKFLGYISKFREAGVL
jgi:hypothetical protein